MQPWMQRLKQNGWVDVALMVGAEDYGLSWREMLATGYARADACERRPYRDSPMAQDVQQALPLERQRECHADRRRNRHIERNGDIRGDGSDCSDERGHPR